MLELRIILSVFLFVIIVVILPFVFYWIHIKIKFLNYIRFSDYYSSNKVKEYSHRWICGLSYLGIEILILLILGTIFYGIYNLSGIILKLFMK